MSDLEYITFILGRELLGGNELPTENDLAYNKCKELAQIFLGSKYNDTSKGLYECLELFINKELPNARNISIIDMKEEVAYFVANTCDMDGYYEQLSDDDIDRLADEVAERVVCDNELNRVITDTIEYYVNTSSIMDDLLEKDEEERRKRLEEEENGSDDE